MNISVVIPVYNGADFIQKSYHSIIDQELENFEIIYVDNNSTDTSVDGINKILEKDSRVKLLYQKKQGASAARNLGIKKAEGKYIYVFDVDDEIFPNALNKMINVLDTHDNVDAVFGKMVKSYQGLKEIEIPSDETHEVILEDKPYWGLKWFSDLSIVVGPPAFLYRKQVFDKIGYYNEAFRIGEDTALDIDLGMTCNVAFLDTYIYLYFKHARSTIEKARKNENVIALHWSRFVKSHLPFYLNNEVPLQYKRHLFSYLYSTIAKQMGITKGYNDRRNLKKKLLEEIKPVKLPKLLLAYLFIIQILPFSYIVKFYIYYIVPYYMKNQIEKL